MDQIFFVGLVAAAFRLATPLVFAALGEAISQRAGVLNVGIEGIMLVGAFAGAWGSAATGSPWLGLGVAIAAGAAAAAVHGLLCLHFRVDQIVSGIALTVLGLGLSGYAYRLTLGSDRGVAIPSFARVDLGALGELPVLGPMLFQHHLLVYVALALAPLLWWFVNRTGWGLAIRACGEEPAAAHAAGIDVLRVRWGCVLVGGALAGAGGAYLSIAQIGNFVEDMVAGRGFIAIACVVYGRWNPFGVLLAALFFGAADAAQIRLQALNPDVPYQFFVMAPYVLAVGALVFVSRRSRLPAALGRPFTPPR
ncbi:MAG: ABC transporter permease [Candidatus Odyssella sp.]|nr:ABC transporter permease [Candidatus Odyssella sp.]